MAAALQPSALREKKNWLIHQLYVGGQREEALAVIEDTLRACGGLVEYPLFVKGLIKRQQGKIHEALQLFQAATALNPTNPANLKQVARSLFLVGRYRAALDVYAEAARVADEWDVWHNKGLCYAALKRYKDAIECFETALSITRQDATFMELAKCHAAQGDHDAALDTYLEALEHSPDNVELLTTLGLAYLRSGEGLKAFEALGSALAHDPRAPDTILAAGSVIQDQQDTDVALVKYRVAAAALPNSARLWSNIGMCFFAKGKGVAAEACLARALYLDPFEWLVAYNCGIVAAHAGQHASAAQFLTKSVSLNPGFAPALALLGSTLAALGDGGNATAAFERALAAQAPGDTLPPGCSPAEATSAVTTALNYAAALANAGDTAGAARVFTRAERLWAAAPEEARASGSPVAATRLALVEALGLA